VGTGTPTTTSSRWSGASRNDRLGNARARRHVQYGTFARGRGGRMQARLLNTAPEKAEADALILPIFEGQSNVPAEAAALDKKLKGAITQLLADHEFRGRFMELVPVHNLGNAPSKWTVLLGLGKPPELDLVRLRNALQAAGRVLRKRGHRRVTVILPKAVTATAGADDIARAATEGIGLSNFDAGSLKTRPEQAVTEIDALSIIGLNGEKSAAAAVKDGLVLAEATNRIRGWVNAPANAFTPTVFVEKVREAVKGTGLDLKVLEVADMRRLKMGALLAVARGSDEPAKMIVLRYGGGRKGGPTLALVGKGITVDSGGISIKPAQNMEMMKSDIGGGASVIGAFVNAPPLMGLVRRSADLAGERLWELPTWADYDGLIDSEIADIKNATVPWAGATTAALFLREFVDGRPWVHLDIAGSAWQDAPELKTVPGGPTGSGVRVMAHLAQLLADR